MTGLSAAAADKLQQRLSQSDSESDPELKLSPEVYSQAKAALDAYTADMASVVEKADPNLPLTAQAGAMQPATNHPRGDEAASEEWLANPSGQSGTVIVYDAPLALAKQKLLENPDLLPALGFSHMPPTAEDIQSMDHDSPIYGAYNDHVYRETADAATKAGKQTYRYSKAPWLQNGGIAPALQSLGLKLKASIDPAIEGTTAFLMGVDDTAAFGAGRAAGETLDMALSPGGQAPQRPDIAGGIESATGVSPKATNRMIEEEHPIAYTAGQVVGAVPELPVAAAKFGARALGKGASELVERGVRALTPWSASNALYDLVARGGQKALAKAGIKSAIAPVAVAALGAGAAGALTQGAEEGVNTAANLAQTGETGTTLEEVGGRMAEAGKFAGALGGLGGVAQQTAGAIGDVVRHGTRFRGLPGQLEQSGVAPTFGRGFQAPEAVKAATEEARGLGVKPQELLAERVAPKVAEGAKAIKTEAIKKIEGENAAFMGSAEGKKPLPVPNFIGTALKKLRGDYEARTKGANLGRGAVPDPVGHAGKGNEVKSLFNQEINNVSLKPQKGAIELTPEEAEAFLTPENQRVIFGKPKGGPPPLPGAPTQPAGGPPPVGGVPGSRWARTGRRPEPPVPAGEEMVPRETSLSGAGPTPAQSLGPLADEGLAPLGSLRPGRAERAGKETMRLPPEREVGRGQQEALELEGLRELKAPAEREAKRLEAFNKETSAPIDYMKERTSDQLGSSKGGFFRGSDGVERYVKQTSVKSQALDEAANTAAYQDLGAETLQSKATMHEGKPIVYSERLGNEWKTLADFKGEATPEMAKGYVRGVPADVMLGSWDLAGNSGNLMTDGKRVMRIDAGGIGPRTLGTPAIQAWEEGLAAFDLDSTGSVAQRGELRQKWAARGGAAAAKEQAKLPYVLAKSGGAQSLSDVKADLQAGLSDVEKSIDAAGGEAGFVAKHYPHLTPLAAETFAKELGKRREFLRENIDKIAMVTALGIGASLDDDKNHSGAAMAAAGGLGMFANRRTHLAKRLRRQGVEKVYVMPRQHSAEHTEALLDAIKGYRMGGKSPANKDLIELDQAARQDRDARAMGGVPGAWSKLKGEQHKRLLVAEEIEKRATPAGEAYPAVSRFARGQGQGDLPRTRALRTAAEKGGAGPELEQTRVPALLEALNKRIAPHTYEGKLLGAPGRLLNEATMRGVYPVTRQLEGPLGPLGMGKAGRAAALKDQEEETPPPSGAAYEDWRAKYQETNRHGRRAHKSRERRAR